MSLLHWRGHLRLSLNILEKLCLMPLTQFDLNKVNILPTFWLKPSLFKYGCILSSSYLFFLTLEWSFFFKRRLSNSFSSAIFLSFFGYPSRWKKLSYDIQKYLIDTKRRAVGDQKCHDVSRGRGTGGLDHN